MGVLVAKLRTILIDKIYRFITMNRTLLKTFHLARFLRQVLSFVFPGIQNFTSMTLNICPTQIALVDQRLKLKSFYSFNCPSV